VSSQKITQKINTIQHINQNPSNRKWPPTKSTPVKNKPVINCDALDEAFAVLLRYAEVSGEKVLYHLSSSHFQRRQNPFD